MHTVNYAVNCLLSAFRRPWTLHILMEMEMDMETGLEYPGRPFSVLKGCITSNDDHLSQTFDEQVDCS